MTIDTVAGLELFAVKGRYGVYLRCDTCGATIDAPRKNTGQPDERVSAEEETLIALARSIGWTGPLTRDSSSDQCPECSHVTESGKTAYRHD